MHCDMTAIVLTKNEERNIANCLESIKGLVSRIVVVDSGSTDRTVEIAQRYHADVYTHRWVHYANQFNWALDNTGIETTWVFRIDADEVVTPELASELREECKRHADDGVSGMEMPFKLYFLGRYLKHGGTYPVWKITVFKYGRGRFEDRAMGEHVVLQKGACIRLKHDCLHHDFKDLSSWIEKHDAYSTRELADYQVRQSAYKMADLQGNAAEAKKMRDGLYYKLPPFIRARLYYWYRYYLKLGFLDGTPGRIYAFLQAYWYRYLVDSKLYESKVVDSHN